MRVSLYWHRKGRCVARDDVERELVLAITSIGSTNSSIMMEELPSCGIKKRNTQRKIKLRGMWITNFWSESLRFANSQHTIDIRDGGMDEAIEHENWRWIVVPSMGFETRTGLRERANRFPVEKDRGFCMSCQVYRQLEAIESLIRHNVHDVSKHRQRDTFRHLF
jgi:hypothetical protein